MRGLLEERQAMLFGVLGHGRRDGRPDTGIRPLWCTRVNWALKYAETRKFGIGVSCSLLMHFGVYSRLGKLIDAGDSCSCMCAPAHLVGVMPLVDCFSMFGHCIAPRRPMCGTYRCRIFKRRIDMCSRLRPWSPLGVWCVEIFRLSGIWSRTPLFLWPFSFRRKCCKASLFVAIIGHIFWVLW
jgi:hypothetical protein